MKIRAQIFSNSYLLSSQVFGYYLFYPYRSFEHGKCRRHKLAQIRWLVWCSGNGVRHVNEVKLRQARLVLGLVSILGVSTIPAFIQATQAHSAWSSLWVGVMSAVIVSAISGKKRRLLSYSTI